MPDDELVGLVEKYPMHIAEIDFIARQSRVRAIMSGRNMPEIEDITHVIAEYRGNKTLPLLFGGTV